MFLKNVHFECNLTIKTNYRKYKRVSEAFQILLNYDSSTKESLNFKFSATSKFLPIIPLKYLHQELSLYFSSSKKLNVFKRFLNVYGSWRNVNKQE